MPKKKFKGEYMVTTAPIVKYDRWVFRVDDKHIACCKLETFFDPKGRYCILATERSDNPGPSITDCHEKLLIEIHKSLKLARKQLTYHFFEQYDRDSYAPPRDDQNEICRVYKKAGKPHWEFVPDEEWWAIYHAPRKPRTEVLIRKAAL